ncbi:bifunctional 3-demethylubiquinone-9 3-methyltransferase/ 2-octaprenyl-6-hydroxy phenol methylase [Stieleria maiorica]|uniref:Bifunctional 3-demethylubiquinone-9 3-methyltransferase/ 2-octaprenyl-6-hydroxy phenol methylase n=1 Tax=Stieleria maiorica TaxID=2795974 RepID=A0A5B9MJC0_9BACT|nr:class I SAM-dependent methyltransferase [Stieleria maiorica]QEG01372.1 bifunctional 3-demethylubiquinone-9 3-methyltransferase/ 2-octaprenyl-6-hydroxy phenol methylase [Stieleria maiorica]
MPSAVTSQNPPTVAAVAESVSRRAALGIRMASVADSLRARRRPLRWVTLPMAWMAESIAIGVMHRRDVAAMVRSTYASRPEFYDPRRYQLPHEARMLPRLLEHRDACGLLDAFCGQGREAKLFADAGYHVTAIDELDWMIRRAQRFRVDAGFSAEFFAQDFFTFDPDRSFDIVYTSCWMYSTIQGSDRRREFLDRCKRLCDENGLAVVSYVNQRANSTAGAWLRFIIAKAAAVLTVGNVRSEFGERVYSGLFWHHLSDATVRREVESAGWQITETVAGTGMEPTFLFLVRMPGGQ